MLHLANAELTLDLLDPDAHAMHGPRFCAGGYLWQIHDRTAGPLLTGPEWPNPTPLLHNGQGLPESFRHSTTTGTPLLWNGKIGLAPGAGALTRDALDTVVITQPCLWQIKQHPARVVFHTAQSVAGWSYELERIIELHGRQVRSTSRLTNRGATPLVLEWFAHPYFALQTDGLQNLTLPAGTQLAENPGYRLNGRTVTLRRAFVDAKDGHLEHLHLSSGQCFAATLAHPRLEAVHFATDFVPFKCVLWANSNTLSLEPFLALNLAPNESRAWTLTYDFGKSIS